MERLTFTGAAHYALSRFSQVQKETLQSLSKFVCTAKDCQHDIRSWSCFETRNIDQLEFIMDACGVKVSTLLLRVDGLQCPRMIALAILLMS
eukprot:6067114-Amphidinium_carterae.1